MSSTMDKKSPIGVQTLASGDLVDMTRFGGLALHADLNTRRPTVEYGETEVIGSEVDLAGQDPSGGPRPTAETRKAAVEEKFQQMSNKLIDIMSHSMGEDDEAEHGFADTAHEQRIESHIHATQAAKLRHSYGQLQTTGYSHMNKKERS